MSLALSPLAPLNNEVYPVNHGSVNALMTAAAKVKEVPATTQGIKTFAGGVNHDDAALQAAAQLHATTQDHHTSAVSQTTKESPSASLAKFCKEAETAYPALWQAIQSNDSASAKEVAQAIASKLSEVANKAGNVAQAYNQGAAKAKEGQTLIGKALPGAHPVKDHVGDALQHLPTVAKIYSSIQASLDESAKNVVAAADKVGKVPANQIVSEASGEAIASAWAALGAKALAQAEAYSKWQASQ